MAEEIVIDLSELTWGEVEEIERLAGADAAAALFAGKVLPSATVVLLWIAMRKKDPAFTLEDARNLPINTPFRVADEAESNPTAAAGNGGSLPPQPSAISSDSASRS